MKKISVVLWVSVCLNLFFVTITSAAFIKYDGIGKVSSFISPTKNNEIENPGYAERTTLFKELSGTEDSIVFLGDSLTYRAEWHELLPGTVAVNRGIGSDTTEGVLNRLEDIILMQPEKVFIMIGINDLLKDDPDDVADRYSRIIQSLQSNTPVTEIFVQSVLPVNNQKYGSAINNDDVIILNKRIKELAAEYDVTYIDLFSVLSNEGQLDSEYTVDGIHLTGKAYKVWAHEIEHLIDKR